MTARGAALINPGEEAETPKPLSIEPQSGVGKVRRGMTEQEVIAGMGQPDSKSGGFLIYSQLGIRFGIGKDGVVFSARFREPFNGSTAEGIRIGSTRAEVIQAYGETDQVKTTKSGSELMHYAKPMMRFYFKEEKVTEIVIDLLKPKNFS